jgi:hypothetical protein
MLAASEIRVARLPLAELDALAGSASTSAAPIATERTPRPVS